MSSSREKGVSTTIEKILFKNMIWDIHINMLI